MLSAPQSPRLLRIMERPSPPSRPDSGVSDVEKAAHSPRADLPQFLAEDNGPALQSSQSASVGVLLFLVCILMHATLAGLHLALVILRYSVHGRSIEVPDHNFNQVTGLLFSRITLLPNAIIKVRRASSVGKVIIFMLVSGLLGPSTLHHPEARVAERPASSPEPHRHA